MRLAHAAGKSLAPLSNAKRYRFKNLSRGVCKYCGRPRKTYAYVCDNCRLKEAARERKRKGCKAWTPGSRGRPPKWSRGVKVS